jgi:hypothetical protein
MKTKTSIYYDHKNGYDYILIFTEDSALLEELASICRKLNLTITINTKTIYINVYTTVKIKELLYEARNLTDWNVAGTLIKELDFLDMTTVPPLDWNLKKLTDMAGITLRDYQLIGINKILNSPCKTFFLNDDFGVGKGVQAILAAKLLSKTKKMGKTIIVCPHYLIKHWKDQISKVCPDLNYEVSSLMSAVKKGRILIIDEVHLILKAKKARRTIAVACGKAEKIIALSGINYDEKCQEFCDISTIIKLNITNKIIKNNFDNGIMGIAEVYPGVCSFYIRRTRGEVGINNVVRKIILRSGSAIKENSNVIKNGNFDLKTIRRVLNISSYLKIANLIKIVSSELKSNENCRIAIASQFPNVLKKISEKISKSYIYTEGEERDTLDPYKKVALILIPSHNDGLTMDFDFLYILDPQMDVNADALLETRLPNGVVAQITFSKGVDEWVYTHSKFSSVKKNLLILNDKSHLL